MRRPQVPIVATTQEHGQELRRLIDAWVLQHESIIAQMLPPHSDSHETDTEDRHRDRPPASQAFEDTEPVASVTLNDDPEDAPNTCKRSTHSKRIFFDGCELRDVTPVDRSSDVPKSRCSGASSVDSKIPTGIGTSFHALKGARAPVAIKGFSNSKSRSAASQESMVSIFGDDLSRKADRQRRSAAQRTHLDLEHSPSQEEPSRLQQVIDHPCFEFFSLLAILSNSIVVGIQVDNAAVELKYTIPSHFRVVNLAYTALFLSELVLRMCAGGFRFFKFVDMWVWNYLDMFIVSTALFELCIDTLAATSLQNSRKTSNLRHLRMLRLIRFLRVIRIARVLRFAHSLRIFLYSIVATMQSLLWAMVLLVAILYVFGMIFTQTVGDHFTNQYNGRDFNSDFAERDALRFYWGSLGRSMFTLFKSISGGVNWHDCSFPLYTIGWPAVVAFIFYVSFTYFAVLNVVTGSFCQAAIDTAQNDAELLIQDQMTLRDAYIQRIQMTFEKMDTDNSGKLTLDELVVNLERPEVIAMLGSLNVDSVDAWALFKLLDTDMTNVITLEEFVTGLMKVKGSVKRTDILELQVQVTGVLRGIDRLWQTINQKMISPMMLSATQPEHGRSLEEEVPFELVYL